MRPAIHRPAADTNRRCRPTWEDRSGRSIFHFDGGRRSSSKLPPVSPHDVEVQQCLLIEGIVRDQHATRRIIENIRRSAVFDVLSPYHDRIGPGSPDMR